jgi:hypothetical protein
MMTTTFANTGKNASSQKPRSQNALKSGIYANKLMEGEDPQRLQDTIDGLVRDFDVRTSIGYQLAQELAQVMLRMSRSERWQCDLIAAHLAKNQTRVWFATHLNLGVMAPPKLPDWYFNDSKEDRENARLIHSACCELEHLIEHHTPNLMMKVKTELPDLWWFVMDAVKDKERANAFSDRLSQYSDQIDQVSMLKDLRRYMLEQHKHEILWAESEDRYEAVLSGLRAQVQMELAANANLQRGETQLHRRKSDLIAQLMQLAREPRTVQISSQKSDPGSAQVITYKPSSQGTSGPETSTTFTSKEPTQPGA